MVCARLEYAFAGIYPRVAVGGTWDAIRLLACYP